ncbi:type I-B CRISPR-associated endonuclease Cas1b [Calorimonas adulescens]|uniref:CRISPR-associated endonuclease Cas1 n=1 Tax=Calorimonas adulescens TaxID=2606906 RepID=A0A5D8QB36_9THEO|nr:type I-B CRISPR-associated endonuclease Cas1b [Calorimonas adulescens]TZE81607.1 type I-B CRISPR-associated endonuclease Cas1 [Calorimonas adulescens]
MKRNYYITKNCELKRKDNTIYLEYNDGRKPIPINDIESIYLFGEITLNTKAINFLCQNGITVHFFNYYGFYTGSLYPKETLLSGYLIVNQVQNYLDLDKRLTISKELIRTASHNILKNVKYYKKRIDELTDKVYRIEKEAENIENAKSISELMGCEGRIRSIYYSTFDEIMGSKFEFKTRVMNPPDNEMNALISFGNSLCYTAVLSEIYRTQLNPTISYLHEPGERRFSLALDISEVFKPILTDRVLFKLVNEKIIDKNDFDETLNFCYLKEDGRRKFIKEFDDKLATTINYPPLNRKVSYRTLIRLECYKLVKHILGISQYKGLKMWW